MSKASLENELRTTALNVAKQALAEHYGLSEKEICIVSASEFALPVTDSENNEKFVLVKISIPRGTRNGTGGYTSYDGYAAADDYADDCKRREAKKEASEAKKKAEAEAKQRKALAKMTIKELREKGLDGMIHEGIDDGN